MFSGLTFLDSKFRQLTFHIWTFGRLTFLQQILGFNAFHRKIERLQIFSRFNLRFLKMINVPIERNI